MWARNSLPPVIASPDYRGGGLVNLVAELEGRLRGERLAPGLYPALATEIPDAETYILVLIDGLGKAQLSHPGAAAFLRANRGTLHCPFPSTTSVSLASVATATPPATHGLVSHLAWIEEAGGVVNTLKWVDLAGLPVSHEYEEVLPAPNLWERLRQAGVEAITVQPGPFERSPLSRLLYRGSRFEAAWDDADLVEATVQLAGQPRRLIFTYLWQVDFAGHVHGLGSPEFATAIAEASTIWEQLMSRLPPGAALIGTSDHGLVEYREEDKLVVRDKRFEDLRFAGDPRGVLAWGAEDRIEELAEHTGADLVDPATLVGPDPTEVARRRLGDHLLLAPPGKVILPPGFDKRLRCYHGGALPDEVEIPLLVR
jgi:hypothetical protein